MAVTDLLIPRKDWARKLGEEELRAELANYLAIERWARRVVGASGASHEGLTVSVAASNTINGASRANYVCTGANDNATIQKAINDVRDQGGGRIVLLEGTYYFALAVNIWAYCLVEGLGDATICTRKAGDTAAFFSIQTDKALGGTVATNAQLRNLKIDGNWSGGVIGPGNPNGGMITTVDNGATKCLGVIIDNVTVTNYHTGSSPANTAGIWAQSTGCITSNCRAYNTPNNGIFAYATDGITLDCRAWAVGTRAIHVLGVRGKAFHNYAEGPTGIGPAIFDVGTLNGVIVGNVCVRNGGAAGGYSLKTFGATGTLIAFNVGYEAYMQNDSDEVIWIGNKVDIGTNTDINQVGFMWGGSRCAFIANTSKSARAHGIYLIRLHDSVVAFNTSIDSSRGTNNGYSGLMLWFQVTDTLVVGNTIRNPTAGNKPKYAIEEQNVGAPDQNQNNIILLNNFSGSGAVTGPTFFGGINTISDFNASGAAGATKVGSASAVTTFGAAVAQLRFALAAANGVLTTPARADHTHGTPEPTIADQPCTADYAITNAQADVTGASVTYVTTRANVKANITAAFDVDITTTGTGLITGQVLVDGAAQTPKVIVNDPGAVDRRQAQVTFSVVLAAAGSHTIKLQAATANAAGVAVAKQDNTRLCVTFFD